MTSEPSGSMDGVEMTHVKLSELVGCSGEIMTVGADGGKFIAGCVSSASSVAEEQPKRAIEAVVIISGIRIKCLLWGLEVAGGLGYPSGATDSGVPAITCRISSGASEAFIKVPKGIGATVWCKVSLWC